MTLNINRIEAHWSQYKFILEVHTPEIYQRMYCTIVFNISAYVILKNLKIASPKEIEDLSSRLQHLGGIFVEII